MSNSRSEHSPSVTNDTEMFSPKRRPLQIGRSLSYGEDLIQSPVSQSSVFDAGPSPEPEVFCTPTTRPMKMRRRTTSESQSPTLMARKPRTPLMPLSGSGTPTSGGGAPRRTPKRSLEPENDMISSLLTGSIVWDGMTPPQGGLPEFTPEKENCVRGVQSLSLVSPANARSPVSTRNFQAPKRAKPDFDVLTPVNQPKKGRQATPHNDLIFGCRRLQRVLGTAGSTANEASVNDEFLVSRPSPRPFSHWNSQSATFPSMESPSAVTKFQQKSHSDSAISIMQSMDKRDDPTLIGDCSRRYTLPFVAGGGKHTDLKEISSETLKALLDGDFNGCIQKFEIVDCRYPYEYAGGHIRGAINLYTELQVSEKFMDSKSALPEGHKSEDRHIIIFHCEFSAQRGPRMCRRLRDWDRNINLSAFPALHYPELYVLHGGYKAFHETCPTHCEPSNYTRMVDPGHGEEFKFCRSKSKTDLVKTKSGCSAASSLRLTRQFSLNKLNL